MIFLHLFYIPRISKNACVYRSWYNNMNARTHTHTHTNRCNHISTIHSSLCQIQRSHINMGKTSLLFLDRGSLLYTLYMPYVTCSTSVACWLVAGDINRIRALVDKDADVNAQDDFGPTSNQCHAMSCDVIEGLPGAICCHFWWFCSFEILKISVIHQISESDALNLYYVSRSVSQVHDDPQSDLFVVVSVCFVQVFWVVFTRLGVTWESSICLAFFWVNPEIRESCWHIWKRLSDTKVGQPCVPWLIMFLIGPHIRNPRNSLHFIPPFADQNLHPDISKASQSFRPKGSPDFCENLQVLLCANITTTQCKSWLKQKPMCHGCI